VSFAAITLCVASQRVFVVYFVMDSVRKLLVTPSHSLDYCPLPVAMFVVIIMRLIYSHLPDGVCLVPVSQFSSRLSFSLLV
jgi:hypothetical protein